LEASALPIFHTRTHLQAQKVSLTTLLLQEQRKKCQSYIFFVSVHEGENKGNSRGDLSRAATWNNKLRVCFTMESSLFSQLNKYLEEEARCREMLRECRDQCDAAVRTTAVLVESLHKERDLSSKLKALYEALEEVASEFVQLQLKVPLHEYYKYNELWRSSLAQAVATGCLVYYLDCNQLADISVLEKIFHPKKQEEGAPVVRIELEDYLVGLCNLVSELSRMSVNRVTIGDFEFAVQAAKFCSEILAGFRLLNFRNDYLRRRFDGMKYDVKKLEEVVYDISIRGLLK